jgi:hypothetical protein
MRKDFLSVFGTSVMCALTVVFLGSAGLAWFGELNLVSFFLVAVIAGCAAWYLFSSGMWDVRFGRLCREYADLHGLRYWEENDSLFHWQDSWLNAPARHVLELGPGNYVALFAVPVVAETRRWTPLKRVWVVGDASFAGQAAECVEGCGRLLSLSDSARRVRTVEGKTFWTHVAGVRPNMLTRFFDRLRK